MRSDPGKRAAQGRLLGRLRRSRGLRNGMIAGGLLLAAALFLVLLFRTQPAYEPPDNVSVLDPGRSQVYVTGEGFHVDRHQKKVHDQVEKQRKKQLERERQDPNRNRRISPTSTPDRDQTPSRKGKKEDGKKRPGRDGPETEDPEDVDKKPEDDGGMSEEEKAKRPVIKTSIVDGTVVQGTKYNFWVKVTDYKGNNVPVFSVDEGKFTVTCNGSAMSSTGAHGKKTKFRATLKDGKNVFEIQAVDREGRKRTLHRWVTCNASGHSVKVGEVTVEIKAPVLNLGTIYHTKVEIEEEDSAKDAIVEAFHKGGFTGIFSGSYLAGIKKAGIAEGAHISDEIREEMERRRRTEQDPAGQDKNCLKEKDFYNSSGWLYRVNGTFPDVGTGSFTVEDGDKVELIFALDDGVY